MSKNEIDRMDAWRKVRIAMWIVTMFLVFLSFGTVYFPPIAGVALHLDLWLGMMLLVTGGIFVRFEFTNVDWFDKYFEGMPIGAVGFMILPCAFILLTMAMVVSASHANAGCEPAVLFPVWMCTDGLG